MRCAVPFLALPARLLLAAAALPCLASAQSFSADYELGRELIHPAAGGADLLPSAMTAVGRLRIGTALAYQPNSGAGLSLEAGEAWFGRLTVGRSIEASQLSLAGGYRWADGQAVSLQLTARGHGQERLGLSVRYDWPRYYLRLGFDPRMGAGAVDTLRFSAGMRF